MIPDLRRASVHRAGAVLLLPADHGSSNGGGGARAGGKSKSSSSSSSSKKDDETPNAPGGGNSGSTSDAETVYAFIGLQDVVQEEGTQVTVEVLNSEARCCPTPNTMSFRLVNMTISIGIY